jgi:hypothetical protein
MSVPRIRLKCLRRSCGYEAVLDAAPPGCPKCKGYPIQISEIRDEEKNVNNWKQPQEVNDIDIAFGGDIKKLMPAWDALPEHYRDMNSHRPSFKCAMTWFYSGLKGAKAVPREGVDPKLAFRHISACLGSWEPKQEHKLGGVAFLLDHFFEGIVTADETYEFSIEDEQGANK